MRLRSHGKENVPPTLVCVPPSKVPCYVPETVHIVKKFRVPNILRRSRRIRKSLLPLPSCA
jgi:hypothetical protein